MWLGLAFLSALLLGFYDLSKKQSLKNNAVIPVLFLNTLFCSLIFIPFVIATFTNTLSPESLFYTSFSGWASQKWILLKSLLVLSSWIFGYYGIKNLPLTIVGPINATRPVMSLVGALLIFGERLNVMQWIGVMLAILSFFLLSRAGKKEGIDFRHNRSIFFVVLAAVLGACSGLFDKFLMASPADGGVGLNRMEVQAWYNVYQCVLMLLVMLIVWLPKHKTSTSFYWTYKILLISIFLSAADFCYLYALSSDGAMISIVSMVRRSNVLVSFTAGVLLLGEKKNWKNKAFDLVLVVIGMIFIYLGTH